MGQDEFVLNHDWNRRRSSARAGNIQKEQTDLQTISMERVGTVSHHNFVLFLVISETDRTSFILVHSPHSQNTIDRNGGSTRSSAWLFSIELRPFLVGELSQRVDLRA